jgi:NADH-quinone oxidoreductase subunit C
VSGQALELVRTTFGDAVKATHAYRGDETAIVDASAIRQICTWLRDQPELKFNMLTDLTAVDYLGWKQPRFQVVYHVYSTPKLHRLRLKICLHESHPVVDTICDIWGSANWMEREIWDLYGIRFTNHPDLRRILLYEEFEGHPLRKDYPKEKRQPRVRRAEDEIREALDRRPNSVRSLALETE